MGSLGLLSHLKSPILLGNIVLLRIIDASINNIHFFDLPKLSANPVNHSGQHPLATRPPWPLSYLDRFSLAICLLPSWFLGTPVPLNRKLTPSPCS